MDIVLRARRAWPIAALSAASSGSGASGASHPAQCGHLPAAHQARAGYVSVRVALAQPHQNLTILEHLETPSAHRIPRRQKAHSLAVPSSVRDACPPAQLAPICRSANGSIMAITPWIHYADLPVAPICRSRPGSNMPCMDPPPMSRCWASDARPIAVVYPASR